jgi:hypothetical protein
MFWQEYCEPLVFWWVNDKLVVFVEEKGFVGHNQSHLSCEKLYKYMVVSTNTTEEELNCKTVLMLILQVFPMLWVKNLERNFYL